MVDVQFDPKLVAQLFDLQPDAVVWYAPIFSENTIIDFEFRYCNTAASRLLGIPVSDIIGATLKNCSFIDSQTANHVFEQCVAVYGGGNPVEFTYFSPIFNRHVNVQRSKALNGILSITRDHTIQEVIEDGLNLKTKHLQQQLELTILGLKRSNERLTEFSHVASHDLNEPLRKIITFSKLLTDRYGPKLEDGAKDYLDRIEKTAMRMQLLLTNLLTYSRVSKPINTFERISLNTVVQEVLSDLETVIAQKNALITTDQLPVINGEKVQLRQLFQNLISNALKFQSPGTQPVISIQHTHTGPAPDGNPNSQKFFLIEVTDNGIGFLAEDSEKIFQLFHRLHARHEFDGTGIGLAIVQRAMENHQGFVDAVSEVGKGSTFRLYFPI